MLAGLIIILLLQASQWFFFDEWAFLKIHGPGLFEPHVGHWSTSPMLLFELLRTIFGLHSYFPFAVAITLIHLAAAHLIWRISIRSGGNAWLATAAVSVFIFLGSGAENILWAFQIGFVGAVVLGLCAVLLVSSSSISWRRFSFVTIISLFSLTWSGTAIPLVAATAIVLVRSSGWARASLFVGLNLALYLSWYAAFSLGSSGNPDTGGFEPHKLFIEIPEFIGVMVLLGYQSVFPLFGIGAVVLLATAVWLIRGFVRRSLSGAQLPAIALLAATIIFAFISAFSRAHMSLGAGRSSRYIYFVFLLMLPIMITALTRAVSRHHWATFVAAVLIFGLAGFQLGVLVDQARGQSMRELGSERLISAALALYIADPTAIRLDARPDPQWAPDIVMSDLIALYHAGYETPSVYGTVDLIHAEHNVLAH